ncbi:putative bifunctional diguanylate cyclase/phosphodiesterase [Candidatus Blastococcus massiliensis]|uniref:putative bifunctional diguanylate cyclase/phosphodiesterase n=1 Tax=Candidatus Blastococcus massiliensis TaxID=1470358 RepID=UPI0004B7A72F|nr:EAL domain-containing protein [Candidatus Blastococcus massiliensis]
MWLYLTALVLVPLVGVVALTTTIVRMAVAEAAGAARSEAAVGDLARLHSARSAVVREIVPSLSLAIIDDSAAATAVSPDTAALLDQRDLAEGAMQDSRAATDEALERLAAGSSSDATANSAVRRATALRAAVDGGNTDIDQLYRGFLALADDLAAAQRRVAQAAAAEEAPVATSAATEDVRLIADAATVAGRLMPEFIGTQLMGAERVDEQAWRIRWEDYEHARRDVGELSQPALRARWWQLRATPEMRGIDKVLGAHADGTATGRLSVQELITLVGQAMTRDAAFTEFLDEAVAEAQQLSAADREAANSRRDRLLALAIGLVLASLAGAVLVGRSVSRALGLLADQAERISHGQLVDITGAGPREARTVSAALATTVAGLRRIQDQAGAVTRGDLSAPVLAEPLPGPLGQLLHASVEQLVDSVREREELQTALAHQAAHDPLTDLPNRTQARTLVTAALHRGRRSGEMTGLLFVDLDGFKAVNDRHGHATGDTVLREVADRLRAALRPGDVVCRLGGDEFVVLVERVSDERELVDLARRLIDVVSEPIAVAGLELRVGASVGIAVSQDGAVDADALFAEADTAAYRAKAGGRGRAELFDETLRAQQCAHSEIETALSAGLAAGELQVHYQPVVHLASGRLEGYEALVRWERPGVGMVPPNDFIPVAESSRLICDLDRWVLHEATRQVAEWRSAAPDEADLTVAVNVSGRHLADPRVVQDVTDALAASRLPARLLVLEVTETVLVNEPAAFGHLAALRELGVTVAIDDFGTGYTSIGQLASMPVDTLKIDRSFISSADSGHAELVALMIRAAHTFGLTVVAEGVEESAQLEWLRNQQCDSAQGYLLSRPLSAEAALAARRGTPAPPS